MINIIGYKLIKKQQNYNVLDFNKVDNSNNYFFGYGNVTGGVIGKLYNISPISSDLVDSSDSFVINMPLKRFHAQNMFNNYKKEPFRFKKLASEIRKEEVLSEFETNFRLHKLQELQDTNYTNSEVSTLSNTNEKRLSLNNGIFKSNDNYAA